MTSSGDSRRSRRGVAASLPVMRRKQPVKGSIAAATDDKDMAQSRQITAQIYRHSRIVEAAESCAHDEHFAFGELQHEAKPRSRKMVMSGLQRTKASAGEMYGTKTPTNSATERRRRHRGQRRAWRAAVPGCRRDDTISL